MPTAGVNKDGGPVVLPDPEKTETDVLLRAAGFSPEKVEAMRSRGVLA
jgi:3,4-dihydroxy-2-butanone 4-phosphate synthase